MIFIRVKTEQRQLETVLATRLTVTAPAITVEFRENRHDLIREVDGNVNRQPRDFHRKLSRDIA